MSENTFERPSSASFGIGLAEAKRREEAAKLRGARFDVSPEVRAARAAILAEMDAKREAAVAAEKAGKEVKHQALVSIFGRGTIDELAEVARSIGRMDLRKIEEVVSEVFRAKARSQAYQPDATAGDDGVALGAGGLVRAPKGQKAR